MKFTLLVATAAANRLTNNCCRVIALGDNHVQNIKVNHPAVAGCATFAAKPHRDRATGSATTVPVARLGAPRRQLSRVIASTGLDSVRIVSPTVRYAGSLVESIDGAAIRGVLAAAAPCDACSRRRLMPLDATYETAASAPCEAMSAFSW